MPSAAPSPAPLHPLVARALADLGRREGDPAIPFAGKRAWCCRFVVACLRDCGVTIPADESIEWNVRSFMRHCGARGWSIPHDSPQFLPGDLIAKQRDGGMHIGIVTADEGGETLRYISGNTYQKGKRGVVWVWENPIAREEITNAARIPVSV